MTTHVTLGTGIWSDLGSRSAKAVLLTLIQPLLAMGKAGTVAWNGIQGAVLRATQGRIRDIQTGRCLAYAAAERSETGKLNDLCSSLEFGFRSPDCTKTQT